MIGVPEHMVDASTAVLAGLSSGEAISGVVIAKSGHPVALVGRYTDTPPFWLGNVDFASGQVDRLDVPLDPNKRYSQLTQCPDGTIYTTSVAPEWDVRLVRLDLSAGNITPLNRLQFNNQPLRAIIRSIACGPSGILYALSDPTNSGTNSLFRVEIATGKLDPILKFDVDRMVFVH
jgi:hypothetical protein